MTNGKQPTGPEIRPDHPALRLDAACDRFEAAWREGRRPRIEDFLGEAAESERTEWLRALLDVELEHRRGAGETPTPDEYLERFPEHPQLNVDAFAESLPRAGSEPTVRKRCAADSDLLFGILALQNNFVVRKALVDAFNAWVADKSRPLGQVLQDRGDLDTARAALLEALAREHLKRHGGDPQRSLAALSSLGSARDLLEGIADPDLTASLRGVAVGRTEDGGAAAPTGRDGATASGVSRFRILRLHAKGGLGEVFVALDDELHREVALKEIQPGRADDLESRARFVLEAEITGNLEHPGVVPVYGLGHYGNGRPFYAMRFVQGDSLKAAIARFHAADGPDRDPGERTLALRGLLGRFIDVCDTIAYAHSRGVLHRDLKPGNIMLGKYGETLVVDWGLAKVVGQAEVGEGSSAGVALRPHSANGSTPTVAGVPLGTPGFMSPEQAVGDLDRLGQRSDVYSLGATLYCLLTGRAPLEGGDSDIEEVLRRVRAGDIAPPRRVKREISAALEAVCLKAMALRPEDRYPSARALAEDIEHWLAGEPVSAYPENRTERMTRWMGRHRSAVRAALATVLILTVGSIATTIVVARARHQVQESLKSEQLALAKVQDVLDELDGIANANDPISGAQSFMERLTAIRAVLADNTPRRRDLTVPSNLDFEADPPTQQPSKKPKGWEIGGVGYAVQVDPTAAQSGRRSLRIHSKQRWKGRFGQASREIPAATAAGKRIRISGYIKTEGISTGYAGLWCVVYGGQGAIALNLMGARFDHLDPRTGLPLWQDNFKGRGVRGTTPWSRFQIELPIAADANRLVFGGLLAGDGTAWFDNLAIEVDGKPLAEALTALPMPRPSTDLNLDFEVDEPKHETPTGWFASGRGSTPGGRGDGYEWELDTTTANSGRQSLRLRSTGEGRAGQFGHFAQSIPASVAAGKRVRVSGYIKTDGITKGYASLWCRIDGPNDQTLGFDNMVVRYGPDGVAKTDDRGVRGTTAWKHCQVEVDVDARAVNIVFGGLLSDNGTAWFDTFAIEVNGRPLAEELATEPIPEQIVSGLTKTYHPLTFSVKEPPNWTSMSTEAISGPGEALIAWHTHSSDEVAISVQKLGQAVSPRILLDSFAWGYRTVKAEVKAEVKPVAGMRAMWLVSTGKGTGESIDGLGEIPTTQLWVAIPRENDVLYLRLTSPTDRYPAALKEFEEMLMTLKVEGKQTKEQAEAQ